jgi:hypothetical protein
MIALGCSVARMNLQSLGAELKKHRIEKQMSVMDISAVTRINTKFLEALEAGDFAVLPQTYVRAFLREYAETVGLNPAVVLGKYESMTKAHTPAPESPAGPIAPSRPVLGSNAKHPPLHRWTSSSTLVLLGLLLVVAVLVTYMLKPSAESTEAGRVEEIPFDKVLEEATATPPQTEPPKLLATSPAPPARPDTLVLQMETTDSVWMQIVIDGKNTEEYLFPPNRRHTWKGLERFQLTMGNAGGAMFRLNGVELGTMGRRGAVIRDRVISKQDLEQRQSSPAP